MVKVNEMAHLVNHHLTDAVFIELYELQIKADVASSGAATPPRPHIADGDLCRSNIVFPEFFNY